MAIHNRPGSPDRRGNGRLVTASLAWILATGIGAGMLPAQVPGDDARARRATLSASPWVVTAPDASLAWFTLLAELRLPGAGAFAFVVPGTDSARSPLGRAVAQSRDFEILHFVPLYYPTANRVALVAAVRAAAMTPAIAPAPRAALLVAALANAIPSQARREWLPQLASALERTQPTAPGAVRLATWQRRLDSLYLPALSPWLRVERLDAGRLIVSPAIGAEGRIFAGTADRSDNIVAVGAHANETDPDAPLFAFVREVCFPAVSRATATVRGFEAADPRSARRASMAAVRCGAELLDRLLPERAGAYRAFWIRQAGQTEPAAPFDVVFPPDPALQPALSASLRRVAGAGQ